MKKTELLSEDIRYIYRVASELKWYQVFKTWKLIKQMKFGLYRWTGKSWKKITK